MADERGIEPPTDAVAGETDAATPDDPPAPDDAATSGDPPVPSGPRFRVRPVIAPRRSADDPGDRVESADETELGWGDPAGRRDGDWYRRERPPHHE